MKGAIILATVIAAVALGACRKEVHHAPMKLGADAAVVSVAQYVCISRNGSPFREWYRKPICQRFAHWQLGFLLLCIPLLGVMHS